MVSDCPHQCPPNRHCNDFTDGQCVCDDFHVEDPDHPDDGCCPGQTFHLSPISSNYLSLSIYCVVNLPQLEVKLLG